mgnify:FL=1
MSYRETLKQAAEAAGFPLTEGQLDQFQQYGDLLLETNKSLNLTAITDPEEVAVKHMVDSLLVYNREAFHNHTIVDVGTGAGFPGLPLKIYDPGMRVTLIDSLQKRLNFLGQVVETLGLGQVRLVHGRAEDAGKDPALREKFDVAVARAVAALPVLAEYCLPLVRVGGVFYAMKGSKYQEEADAARHAVEVLGGKIREIRPVQLPGLTDKRAIITIEKVRSTPKQYPRKAGMAVKKPL